MKIKDLVIGTVVVIPLVIKNASARETKNKKPYLALELYDGMDSINGNYWDWKGAEVPPKGRVFNFSAEVTEWQQVKQLNIRGISTNNEIPVTEFMPRSGLDINAIYEEAYNLMSNVSNSLLRAVAIIALEKYKELWLMVPGAKTIHHAYAAGTLIHSLSVAKLAGSMAAAIPLANEELCLVGGMLHDIGKLSTYWIDTVTIDMTDLGKLFDHVYLGAKMLEEIASEVATQADKELVDILTHIVLSHHGKQEFGAIVPPMCIEAHIVSHADGLDATVEQIVALSNKKADAMWTDRVWALENKPQLTYDYVEKLMDAE